MDAWTELLDDLVAEQRYLDDALAGTGDAAWQSPTPCNGWLVRDVIAHLAEVDEQATAAATSAILLALGSVQSHGTRNRPAAELALAAHRLK